MLMSSQPSSLLHLAAVLPVRDDWSSAAELLRGIDQAVCSLCTVDVLLVDDGSVESSKPLDFLSHFTAIRTINVLRLRRNLGHQRAIAIGLVHVEQAVSCHAVLVMDADGEDTPDGVVQLIRAFSHLEGSKAVFAERTRRTESFAFCGFYRIYKVLHLILTGIAVRVGNFSLLPSHYTRTLVVMSELWNHYAAAVFRSGLPFTTTPIPRGHRIAGKSRMNFFSLTAHGLSAISVFGDLVGVRLLAGSLVGSFIAAIGIVTVMIIRIFTDAAIPGWTTYSLGILAIILTQFITLATTFTFSILSSRVNVNMVPLRDHDLFVAEVQRLYPHE